jgi:hypothetical protein
MGERGDQKPHEELRHLLCCIIQKMLKKWITATAAIVTMVFIIIQFFQPKRNESPPGENSILTIEQIPGNIKSIFAGSCFDCHSDNTRYLWFDRIAPVSWYIAGHVREGKEKLNFSDWGKLDATEKVGALATIHEEIKSGNMPVRSYTFIHRKAKLSEQQAKELVTWTDEYSKLIMAADTIQ